MSKEFIKNVILEGSGKAKRNTNLDEAISELILHNYFGVIGNSGPYIISLNIIDDRLMLSIKGKETTKILLSLRTFRRMVRDYAIILESYEEVRRFESHEKIEAIDMGRRALHNEGAELLINMLEGRVNLDFETARQFFTIITILHL